MGRWWLAVLLLQPVALVITAVVFNAIAGDEPVRAVPGLASGTLLTSAVFLVIASTGEEVGWRGLALPALQARHGAGPLEHGGKHGRSGETARLGVSETSAAIGKARSV